MTLRLNLREDLERDEAKRGKVYDDATGQTIRKGSTVVGTPTIGIGRNLVDNPLSDKEIYFLLDNDIDNVTLWCLENLPYFNSLSEIRQRVVCNMVFQLGETGFRKFADLNIALRVHKYDDAAIAMKHSLWARQTPGRANRLIHMMKYNEVPL